ncbi:hypothetical protein KX816_13905 [Sphingosinicellaceae bacterium]|nr:hypothetical protein KX816_13905 [Sphingosinicellaceae bacterium]
METGLIMIGVGCIIGAIVGGGVKFVQLEFAQAASLKRQVMLDIFGVILVAAGLATGGDPPAFGNCGTTQTKAAAQPDRARTPMCLTGFVRREAFPGDTRCVTPDVRDAAAQDNVLGRSRRTADGGPYDNVTCRSGFVWREASPTDHVCVSPERRQQTALDNAAAAPRAAPQ